MSDRAETARRVRRFLTAPPPGLGTVGKYRIVRKIGAGGMATVYEAEDAPLRRHVALKVLEAADDNPMRTSRFHREAAIAAQLRHPNIVAIHEVGLVRGEGTNATHYIAMDLVDGDSLANLLASRPPSQEDLLRWLEEIARAAAFAHEHGIVHRDIKPGNILIDKSGRALLTDFGLARAAWFSVEITRSHAVLGTPGYMAPEQVSGHAREVGARTDVYALGVVLYEMLAGRRPFDSETPGDLYRDILEQDPPALSRVRRAIPRELEVICLKAMDKSPDRRYRTALELAEDVARFRKGEPIAARPLHPLLYAWRRVVRRRAVLLPIVVAALAGAALVGWIVHDKAVRSRETEERSTQAAIRDKQERLARERARLEHEALQETEEARALLEQPTNEPSIRRSESSIAQAVAFLESAVGKAPHLAAPHLHLGRAYGLQGHEDRALSEFDEAIRLNSALSQAFLERGKIRSKRREWNAAIEDFSSALSISPVMAEARTGRIRALDAKGDGEGALADADELVRTHPRSTSSYMLRAELRKRSGNLDPAVEDCTQAITLDPGFPNTYVIRGQLRQRQGKTAEALADFQKALAVAPPTWQARRSVERAVENIKRGSTEPMNGIRIPTMLTPKD